LFYKEEEEKERKEKSAARRRRARLLREKNIDEKQNEKLNLISFNVTTFVR